MNVKYKKKYARELVDYFKKFLELRDDPGPLEVQGEDGWFNPEYKGGDGGRPPRGYPTLTKFAIKIGVHQNTLTNWAKEYPEFYEAMEFAKAIQADVLDERALTGRFDGRVAMKIRELNANAHRLTGDDSPYAPRLQIEVVDHREGSGAIDLKTWEGDVVEDSDYKI